MALAVLSIDLVAKMAKFEADMGKAARASQKTADQISGAFSVIKGAAGGLAGAFSIGALVTFTKATIDSIDALNDVADATGASIENISALEDIAARTGTTMDVVSGALVKFNGVLKDAKPGNDAERSLTALGLSFKELRELDPAEALRRTAVALSGFADDGNKARIVQDLFGKSVKEAAPFLKDLAEQGGLVAKVTKEQAEEAEKFNKELFAMQKTIQDVSRALVGPLVASINETIEKFREGAKAGKGYYAVIRDEQLRMLGMNDGQAEYAARLAEVTKQLAKGDTRILVRNALIREQLELQAKLKKSPDFSLDNESSAENARLNRKPKLAALPDASGKTGGSTATRQSDAERYLESLQKQLEKTQELSAVEQVMTDISKKRLGNVTASQQDALLNIAKQIDATKAQEAAEKRREEARNQTSKYFEGIAREQAALEDSNASLMQNVEAIGLSKEAVNALTLARIDAAIATEQEKLAIVSSIDASSEEVKLIERKIELLQTQKNLTARGQIAQGMADSVAKQEEASKDFAKTLESDMKGAFSAAFRDTKDPLGAFGDALANVIYSRAATALADSLTGSLFGSGGAGGGILSGIGSALGLSFDGGGYTGSGSRTGGLDGKGGFMAMLHPKETVIDHTKGQSAGGSVVVNQSFTVGDVASVTMVRQAVANSQRQLVAALGRSTNYGGAIA